MSDLDDELLQVAGQAGRVKVESSKRKRAPQMDSDSEDVSLDDESDWEAQETASKCALYYTRSIVVAESKIFSRGSNGVLYVFLLQKN